MSSESKTEDSRTEKPDSSDERAVALLDRLGTANENQSIELISQGGIFNASLKFPKDFGHESSSSSRGKNAKAPSFLHAGTKYVKTAETSKTVTTDDTQPDVHGGAFREQLEDRIKHQVKKAVDEYRPYLADRIEKMVDVFKKEVEAADAKLDARISDATMYRDEVDKLAHDVKNLNSKLEAVTQTAADNATSLIPLLSTAIKIVQDHTDSVQANQLAADELLKANKRIQDLEDALKAAKANTAVAPKQVKFQAPTSTILGSATKKKNVSKMTKM